MKEKLWGGRFSKELNKEANDFNSSLSFDCKMYKEDILGSIAHAKMLGECQIIPLDESVTIINGLKQILDDIENNKLQFDFELEDIHTQVERWLIDRIGEIGKKVHTGRSRNDQVALDLRMHLKNKVDREYKIFNIRFNFYIGKHSKRAYKNLYERIHTSSKGTGYNICTLFRCLC